nr:probable F-actin-capping protein subunit beta [Tanacetum cinerariifolium]
MPRWTCGKTRLDMIPNGVLTTVLEVETIISKMSEGMLRWVWTCQEKATTSSSKESQSPYSRRSPWSNKYHPPLKEGLHPSLELRKLEIEANEVFTLYRDQYYEGGVSSVYLWEDDDQEGFSACFLIKKGGWDAIHVIEVGPEQEVIANYCLTSTEMLSMTTDHETSGTFSLSGSIRRHMKADLSVADGHLCNMGKMIEELEGKLRYSLDQVYFGKTKEMIWKLRPPAELPSTRLP